MINKHIIFVSIHIFEYLRVYTTHTQIMIANCHPNPKIWQLGNSINTLRISIEKCII